MPKPTLIAALLITMISASANAAGEDQFYPWEHPDYVDGECMKEFRPREPTGRGNLIDGSCAWVAIYDFDTHELIPPKLPKPNPRRSESE